MEEETAGPLGQQGPPPPVKAAVLRQRSVGQPASQEEEEQGEQAGNIVLMASSSGTACLFFDDSHSPGLVGGASTGSRRSGIRRRRLGRRYPRLSQLELRSVGVVRCRHLLTLTPLPTACCPTHTMTPSTDSHADPYPNSLPHPA